MGRLMCGRDYQTRSGKTVEIIEEVGAGKLYRGRIYQGDKREAAELIYREDGSCAASGGRSFDIIFPVADQEEAR